MPFVSAARGTSPLDFAVFFVLSSLASGKTMPAIAGHSRLISFVFWIGQTPRTRSSPAIVIAVRYCIRATARICSTSRQACIAGSDLA
jgi:hypothetical protein